VAAAILVAWTGDPVWDTAVALAIGLFVAVRAVPLGRQVLAVLGQHVPEGLELDALVSDLAAVEGVADVHDLHVWTLTSGMNVATAHLVLLDDADGGAVLVEGQRVLRERYGVEHATLQVEDAPTRACREVSW
jgi:cobalt-zinc-cadmium efflux system protein